VQVLEDLLTELFCYVLHIMYGCVIEACIAIQASMQYRVPKSTRTPLLSRKQSILEKTFQTKIVEF